MKKNNMNKGFTLVELIVVLVILAILAAILVPALLGYIDNARSKQIVLNARSAMIAAQAEMSSIYGQKNGMPKDIEKQSHKDSIDLTADFAGIGCAALTVGTDTDWADANKTDGVSATKTDHHEAFTIVYVYFKDTAGEEIWFDGGSWVDVDPASSITNLKKYVVK